MMEFMYTVQCDEASLPIHISVNSISNLLCNFILVRAFIRLGGLLLW